MKRITILVAFLFITHVIHSQWREAVVENLGNLNGLNAEFIHDIQDDSTGYIYFGTEQGLARYDGGKVTVFRHDPIDSTSIGPGEVYTILRGREGYLYLGMSEDGLNIFDPRHLTFQRINLPPHPSRIFAHKSIHGMLLDSENRMWLGGQHGKLYEFDPATRTFTRYAIDHPNLEDIRRRGTITEIIEDRYDRTMLWMTVLDVGYAHFNKITGTFETFPGGYGALHQLNRDTLLSGSWDTGLRVFNPRTKDLDMYWPPDHLALTGRMAKGIFSIQPFHEWFLLTSRECILRMDRSGQFDMLYSDPLMEFASSTFLDRYNYIWIGTSKDVLLYKPEHQFMQHYSFDIYEEIPKVAFGQFSANPQTNTLYFSSSIIPNLYIFELTPQIVKSDVTKISLPFRPRGIAVAPDGTLLIADENRLHVYHPKSQSVSAANHWKGEDLPVLEGMRIEDLEYLEDGRLLLLGRSTLTVLNPDLSLQKHLEILPPSGFLDTTSADVIRGWYFSGNKVFIYSNVIHSVDLGTLDVTQIYLSEDIKPSDIQIRSVIQDTTGKFWVSSKYQLSRFTFANDSLSLDKEYTYPSDLRASWAFELYLDHKGRIWTFSSVGLGSIDIASGRVLNCGEREGLPDNYTDPYSIHTFPDGRFAFANRNGITILDPDNLWEQEQKVGDEVVIKSILVNGQKPYAQVDPNFLDAVHVESGSATIDIEFQALKFPSANTVNYSYQLEGSNPNWISLGQNRFLSLNDLNPGTYTLNLKSGGPNANGPVKSLGILVPTPLWQQAWFLVLCILILVGVLLVLYRYRIRQIQKREREKSEIHKQMAELELKALRSQMNPHFMFNSLNSIKNYILKAQSGEAAQYLSSFAHLIRLILQNSREKEISLQDELDALLLYIELEQLRFKRGFEFACHIDDDIDMHAIQIPPMLLQPFIENAIWHGLLHKTEPGVLSLSFHRNGDWIDCIIEDNGIGRAAAAERKSKSATQYKSMGMGITRGRIEIMNRMDALGINIHIIDKTDEQGNPSGTRVVIAVPARSGSLVKSYN